MVLPDTTRLIENPRYKEIPRHEWPKVRENSWFTNWQNLYITDDNMKPIHIELPAEFTEFYVKRGSDTLLIVVGESWTYGETFPGIGTGAGKFNFLEQLSGCMSTRMAEATGWDVYQFAIPGNCNLYMSLELRRILKHVATLGYKQVKVVLQMTENSREIPVSWQSVFTSHPINDWWEYPKEKSIGLLDWFAMYDEVYYEYYQETLNMFTACPIEGILWRNFTKAASEKKNYNFKMIEPTMVTYTARLCNHDHEPPYLMNPMMWQDLQDNSDHKIIFTRDFMEEQVHLIERMFDYIGGDKDVKELVYHSNHPTKIGHMVWAHHLVRQAGWKDI